VSATETSVLNAIDAPIAEEPAPPPGYFKPILILLIAYTTLSAVNLDIQSIENPDEPRYAVPARIMAESSDWNTWLVPEFNTKPRLLKPIFFYWLIAATTIAGKAVGLAAATAMRLGPLLMGLLGVIGTYLLGRKIFGPRGAFMAAVMLMTSYYFHKISRELVVDMALTAWLLWAWYFCFVALDRIARRRPRGILPPDPEPPRSPALPLLGFYVCLGLACMTKGPALVALFIVVPLLAYLWWDGRLGDLLHAGAWWGAPLALLIGCWWFYAVMQQGHDIIGVLKTENIARAVGKKDHQDRVPFLFYIERLGLGLMPWCVLIPFAAWWTVGLRNVSVEVAEDSGISAAGVKFLICALLVPFLMLGIIISKRELYILPLYPFFALWLAWFWENTFLLRREKQPAPLGAAGLIMLAMVVLAGGVIVILLPQKLELLDQDRIMLGILGGGIVIGLFVAARSLKLGRRYAAVLQMLAVAAALTIGYEALARPLRERNLDSERFYAAVKEKIGDRKIVLFGLSSNEAIWYLDRRKEPIDDLRRPELKARFFESPGTVMLASRAELDKSPELEKSIRLDPSLSEATIKRGKELFVLAVPDPAHPPDEKVFQSKSKSGEPSGSED
jgi:4-amino-4-deoxy-L-arabinose transferase-like glycosyltransferase